MGLLAWSIRKGRKPKLPPSAPRDTFAQAVRVPLTSRKIQISKHAPMNPAIR
jgi:hypothetical protein